MRQELLTTPEKAELVRAAAWWSFSWERFLLSVCVAFHAAVAVVLTVLGHYWWAAIFVVPAVAALLLLRRVSTGRLLGAVYTAGPLGFAATPAFASGVLGEDWYVPGIAAWLALYLIFGVAVGRLALEKR